MDWLRKDTVDGWERSSAWIGRMLDWTTPNWITATRILAAFAVAALIGAWIVTGSTAMFVAVVVTLALLLLSDWFDGALSRYQRETHGIVPLAPEDETRLAFLARLSLRGPTHTGKWLDPLADKAIFCAVLLPAGIGFMPGWLIGVNVLFAALLTFVRVGGVRQRLGLTDVGANWFGKRKMWIEVLHMSALVLLPRANDGWWRADYGYAAALVTLLAATVFAGLSLAGQFLKNRSVPAGAPS